MTYTIGCRWLDSGKEAFTFQKDTAQEVLNELYGVEQSDVRIEYIDTPENGRLDSHGFRLLYGKKGLIAEPPSGGFSLLPPWRSKGRYLHHG